MDHWLISEYGIQNVYQVESNLSLESLNDLIKSNRSQGRIFLTYYAIDTDMYWGGWVDIESVSNLSNNQSTVRQERVSSVSDLPLSPLKTYDISSPDFDEDMVEAELLEEANRLIVLTNQHHKVISVIQNQVAGTSNPLSRPLEITAFHPLSVHSEEEHNLLIYAHLPSLIEKVIQIATAGNDQYVMNPISLNARQLPVGTRITIEIDYDENEVEFSTNRLTQKWKGHITTFDFQFEASAAALKRQIKLRLSVQVEDIEIGYLDIAIYVTDVLNGVSSKYHKTNKIGWHENVFISYAKEDTEIVRRFYDVQGAIGNGLFVDVKSLRASENWRDQLKSALQSTDILQLFWSEDSAKNKYVQWEYKYFYEYHCGKQISNCEFEIRPVYWKTLFPSPTPPPELAQTRFKRILVDVASNLIEARLQTEDFWSELSQKIENSNANIEHSLRQIKHDQRRIYQSLDDMAQYKVDQSLHSINKLEGESSKLEDMMRDIRKILIHHEIKIANQRRYVRRSLDTLTATIDSDLALQHKLEVTIPIVPFLLAWKTELGAGTNLDLNTYFEKLQGKWNKQIS